MDSNRLKLPLSESDKLQDSVLGCRFNEKAEHLPIKKRRFVFRTSSPQLDSGSSEGTEQVAACPNSSRQEVQPKPDASCPPAASLAIHDLHRSGSIDSKVDEDKLEKATKKASEDEDTCCTSLVALAAGSNDLGGQADVSDGTQTVSYGIKNIEALETVKMEADVTLGNMSAKEIDFHISTAPPKDVASTMHCSSMDKATVGNSTTDESTLNNSFSHVPLESECSRVNQVTSKTQNSTGLEDRLNWDLNTVMDAWEEPLECSTSTCAGRKSSSKEGKFEDGEKGGGCGRASEKAGSEILHDLKSLAHAIDKKEQEEHKPGCNDINKLSDHGVCSSPRVAVNKMQSLQHQHVDVPTAIPVAVPKVVKLEYPTCDISAKHVNVNCKGTNDLSCPVAAGTKFSLDYSTQGFVHHMDKHPLEENVVPSTIAGSGNNGKQSITTAEKTENDNLQLSLVTMAHQESGAHQSGNLCDEDDKAHVKKAITSNGITMKDLIGKGTSQHAYLGDRKTSKQTIFGSVLGIHSLALAKSDAQPAGVPEKGDDQPAGVPEKVDGQPAGVPEKGDGQPAGVPSVSKVVCSGVEVAIKTEQSPVTVTSGEPLAHQTGSNNQISHESHSGIHNDLANYNKGACEEPLKNDTVNENLPSDIQAGSEVDNVGEFSVGYDSQFEDGEVRESSIQTWQGSEGRDREDGKDNKGTSLHLGNIDVHESSSQCEPESSSRIRSTDVGSQRGADEISSVLLPEKLDSSDLVSDSEPNETTNGTREVSMKDATQSDQWKMNVSGSENQSSVNNGSNIRDLSCIKLSRYASETEDLETKAEGPKFYRREPMSRIGEPPTRDSFLDRGGFRIQGCSSDNADESAFRPVKESGVLRSLRWNKHSSNIPASGRGGSWNHSPGRDRDLHSSPYLGPSFRRPLLEDVASDDNLKNDPNDDGRPGASSYVARRSFRNRLLADREEDAFRARLGLRPSGDMCNSRFVNVGRGKSLRYGSRHNGGGPRGRYYGSPGDDYEEPSLEYSNSFPSRRRCFSPTERRENHPCAHHHSGSTSPPISRTRSPIIDGFRRHSRSPNLRTDTRMRRPRSPNFRHDFEAGGYNMEPRNNNSPPGTRWVKYKHRSTLFDRRSPPPPGKMDPPPIGERLTFYDSSRKPKQNENYRSGHPGRFSDLHGRYLGSDGDVADHGYRRGGFVRRYEMGSRPVEYEEEEGYGPVRDKEGLEFHGRGGNPKPFGNGTDSRFRDFPRRPREEREGQLKRKHG